MSGGADDNQGRQDVRLVVEPQPNDDSLNSLSPSTTKFLMESSLAAEQHQGWSPRPGVVDRSGGMTGSMGSLSPTTTQFLMETSLAAEHEASPGPNGPPNQPQGWSTRPQGYKDDQQGKEDDKIRKEDDRKLCSSWRKEGMKSRKPLEGIKTTRRHLYRI